MDNVLILGSGPNVVTCEKWPKAPFDKIVSINNAWSVRDDWDDLIYPHDFAPSSRPQIRKPDQRFIEEDAFVPAQNAFGGFVYAGGTMAFTAGYWALHHYKPKMIAFLGCDMVYSGKKTHFYGQGTADPLRKDITLRSLEAKSARLLAIAARNGCAVVNLSEDDSRLVFPRSNPKDISSERPVPIDLDFPNLLRAKVLEASSGYFVPSGRYWDVADRFDPTVLDEIDQLWMLAVGLSDTSQNARLAG